MENYSIVFSSLTGNTKKLPVSQSQCIQRFDFTAEKNIKYNTIALLKIPSGKTENHNDKGI